MRSLERAAKSAQLGASLGNPPYCRAFRVPIRFVIAINPLGIHGCEHVTLRGGFEFAALDQSGLATDRPATATAHRVRFRSRVRPSRRPGHRVRHRAAATLLHSDDGLALQAPACAGQQARMEAMRAARPTGCDCMSACLRMVVAFRPARRHSSVRALPRAHGMAGRFRSGFAGTSALDDAFLVDRLRAAFRASLRPRRAWRSSSLSGEPETLGSQPACGTCYACGRACSVRRPLPRNLRCLGLALIRGT